MMQESNQLVIVKDVYPFDSLEEQKRFNKIIQELRCTVCQNQSLSDSRSPLALDLKGVIYHQIRAQYSDQQIVEFVVHRYGNFVRYQPPFEWNTALLWLGPCIILGLSIFIIKKYIKL